LPAGAVELACHAALPVVIDPTFLNLLRINFFMDPPDDLPWTVEADLLASPLFRELGGELFEIDEDLRRLLLVSLRTRYGTERVEQVALLLERYCDEPGVWGGQPYLAQAQRLTVVGIVEPAAAISWLDDIQTDGASHVDLSSDWIVAMRGRLTAQPAAETTLGDEIAEAVQRLRDGDPAARTELTALDLLPGTDRDAIRAAQEEIEAAQPSEPHSRPRIIFDDTAFRVQISLGQSAGSASLPLSGFTLEAFADENYQYEVYVDLKNRGGPVYVQILEIDPEGRIRLVGGGGVGGNLMLEGMRSGHGWGPDLNVVECLNRRYDSADRDGLSSFSIVVVVSDAFIDLGALRGRFIPAPESVRVGAAEGGVVERLKDLMAIHGVWNGIVRIAMREISYAVDVQPSNAIRAGGLYSPEGPQLLELEREVVLSRQLVRADRAFYLPRLAESLGRLAASLAGDGRYVESVESGGEAVDLYREIVAEDLDGRPYLAAALSDFSRFLAAMGRYSDALAASEEAVVLCRSLASEADGDQRRKRGSPSSGQFLGWELEEVRNKDLSEALSVYSQLLAAVGRYTDAIAIIDEALSLCRRLGERYSDLIRRDLAVFLNVRSQLLVAVGRLDEALADSGEALSLYRQLAAENPLEFNPGLAATLTNLSRNLESVGRYEDALQAGMEGIGLHRELVKREYFAFSPGLAAALNDWSRLLVRLGRLDEALVTGEEAVRQQRRIVERIGSVHRAGLSAALSNLSRLLAQIGRLKEAAVVSSEAIALYREIPSMTGLAGELAHRADVLTGLGRSSDAERDRDEADSLRGSSGSRVTGEEVYESEEVAPTPEADRQPCSTQSPAGEPEMARPSALRDGILGVAVGRAAVSPDAFPTPHLDDVPAPDEEQRRGRPWGDLNTQPDEHAGDVITGYPSARPAAAGSIHGVGITVLVTDLERSTEFYRDVLGFHEIDNGDGSAVLASGDTRLVLRTVHNLSAEAGRLIYLNLEVGDIEAVHSELREKGVKFVHSPRPVNRGDKLELWSATFRDPDNHNIAITQWRTIQDPPSAQ
jgi:tetratricopeptide (TPR) repeat protein/catechol 2,3-dioxygenase-like lactoylglutathione lyase family enzyme